MKRLLTIFLFLSFIFYQPAHAKISSSENVNLISNVKNELAIKKLIRSQVKYANHYKFDKYISTYDKSYTNDDGLNIDSYSKLIKDVWKSYKNIKYKVDIKDIAIKEDTAVVTVTETANANLDISSKYPGVLTSYSDGTYYLKYIDGKWKVISDKISSETTTMLYGEAIDMDAKLSVPNDIKPNTEYTATLELNPVKETITIASLTSDKIEYPQKSAEEVFRALPEDNILERLFTSNNEKKNEYVVATIGLTKAVQDTLSFKISLVGFGYIIKRVNVLNTEG